MPKLVKFAYIPRAELQIHENSQRRDSSPDYATVGSSNGPRGSVLDHDEHVLVLDFEDNSRGKKPAERYVCMSSHTAYSRLFYEELSRFLPL